MTPQKEEDDLKREKPEEPEERKGLFERISDFINQPLPGTAPREASEQTPAAETAPAPTPEPSPGVAPTPTPVPMPSASPDFLAGGGTVMTPPAPVDTPAPAPAPVEKKEEVSEGIGRTSGKAAERDDGVERSPEHGPLGSAGTGEPLVSDIQKQTGVSGGVDAPPPEAGLVVGASAYVRKEGGMPLRLRSAPDINTGNIVARLPIGMHLTLLEGPQEADGYEWWHVRTSDGRTGWVAGSELVTEPQ